MEGLREQGIKGKDPFSLPSGDRDQVGIPVEIGDPEGREAALGCSKNVAGTPEP